MESKLFTQNTAEIKGRKVWHYLIDTPIGQYNVIQWEKEDQSIDEVVIPHNYDVAEEKFEKTVKAILNGKL